MKSVEGGTVGALSGKMGPFTYETTDGTTGVVLIVQFSPVVFCICLEGLAISALLLVSPCSLRGIWAVVSVSSRGGSLIPSCILRLAR